MRLIDADRLVADVMGDMDGFDETIDDFCGTYGQILDWIKNAPTIDAVPVAHGQWELGTVEPGYLTPGGNRPWICSECGQVISWGIGKPKANYCPNCGAKMDAEG